MSKNLPSQLRFSMGTGIPAHYRNYRLQGASVLASFLSTVYWVLGWMFFRLESSSWQWVRSHRASWYAHIAADHPRTGDFLRYIIQSVWLLIFVQVRQPRLLQKFNSWKKRSLQSYYGWMNRLPEKIQSSSVGQKISSRFPQLNHKVYVLLFSVISLIAVVLLAMCITQPFEPLPQLIFLLLLWATAMSIRHIPGRVPVIMLVVFSLIVSCRYLWWRFSATLIWNDPISMFFGVLLIFAETYIFIVLVLGFFQSIWTLERRPVPLPTDTSSWPTVDVMITTYNEDLHIIKPGVYAALGLDWPADKLNIYILDDGNRASIKKFAAQVGVNYLARPSNEHAKAGNINYGLQHSNSELVVLFDCDHVVTHSFLQLTVGWFLIDNKLAILQTPHHFFSPDPFERNLGSFQETPNESALFYGVIQDGNDMWDATYFCGSAGILRRSALAHIGGLSVESVTEDALTSIRLQREGYTSAYICIPMAAGLATESLSGHIGQRIRWARGMVQILRIDNPLTAKGLKLPQRLCYFNAILHFLSGIPRLIFLVTPVAFLVLYAQIIYAPAVMVILYALPHILHAVLANSRIQGKYRHFLWNEIYETVMAWYIAVPTTMALVSPHKGKFNVTAKGGLIKERYIDWVTARPYIVLLLINLIGLAAGIWRLTFGPRADIIALLITTAWVLYNIAILGGALGVDVEARQLRKSHRVKFSMPAMLARKDGHLFPCTLRNYSDSGVGLEMYDTNLLKFGEEISLILKSGREEFTFPSKVMRIFGREVGIRMTELTVQQNIDFMQCTFARADTWALWQQSLPEDKPLASMRNVFQLDFRGYLSIIEYTPALFRNLLINLTRAMMWVLSFLPRNVKNKTMENAVQ